MRYWALFAAKLAGVAVFLGLAWPLIRTLLPMREKVLQHRIHEMGDNLFWYSLAVYGFWMVGAGLVYLAVWDQRYRCRTCLRRLRMPIERGSWSRLLTGRPTLEYICPFGHGTLKVPQLHLTGKEPTNWAEHQDIWKELEELSTKG